MIEKFTIHISRFTMRFLMSHVPHAARRKLRTGFTLVETLVAISLLTVAIVAPMGLAAQSLQSAYYARDQITAFYLAQEAIESIRAIRDSQVLQIAKSSSGSSINLFGPIPLSNQPFTIDARKTDPGQAIAICTGSCPPLQTDGTLYGYQSGWQDTYFTRTVRAAFVQGTQDEIRISVTVSWKTAGIQARSFTISSDLYRWVNDGSGA
jgi:prepilin-type N-terminal cleavage/methylation domain-containing protein